MNCRTLLYSLVALAGCASPALPGDDPTSPDAGAPELIAPGDPNLPPIEARVVVSLTFDDGWAEQLAAARDIIAQRGGVDTGFRATLYINSGYIDGPGRMTWSDVRELQTDGHEIGGHTAGHRDMGASSPDEQRAQICNDRVKLAAEGVDARSFAFPFGHSDASAVDVVRDCGYASARLTTGLGCDDACPPAESLPPADLYGLRAYPSIDAHPLDDVKGWIEAARAEGGWVPITFHHIGLTDDCTSGYCWNRSQLEALVAWLDAPEQRAYVRVATVGELVADDRAAPPSLRQLVTNGAMDRADRHGTSDCFQRISNAASSGSSYQRVADGSGAHEVIETQSYARPHTLVTKRDRGACAPFVYSGNRYQLALRYRADAHLADVHFVIYGRQRSTGAWIELVREALGSAPGDGTWRGLARAIEITDPDIGNISFGMSLRGPGRLAVDDFHASEAP